MIYMSLPVVVAMAVAAARPAHAQDMPDFADDGERAMSLLDAASRLLPGAGKGNNALKEQLAESYARLGGYDQAKLTLATIAEAQRAVGLCKVAAILAERDDIDACQAMLDQVGDRSAVLEMPFSKIDYKELAYIQLIAAKLRAADPAGASALMDRVTTLENRHQARRTFLRGAAENGQLDVAVQSVERIGDPGTEAELRCDLIDICIDNGDLARAVQIYNQITNTMAMIRAREQLIRAYVAADRLADARQLAMTLEQPHLRSGAMYYVVHALVEVDRIDDAQQIFNEMEDRGFNWVNASRSIAAAVAGQGHDALARQRLDAIMESAYEEKANARFYGYLDCAIAAFDAGRTEQATAYLDHAVELHPQLPKPSDFQYERIAATYAHTGRIDEALAVVDAHFDTVTSKDQLIVGLGFSHGIGVKLAQQDRLDVLLQLLRRLQDEELTARVLVDIADKLAADPAK
jgi:tetratricopeptide (TPR) repeat protein